MSCSLQMDTFLEQLKALCAAYPTRAKWVFVPTHAIGRTFGDRLVLEGTDWANLRFVTPLDIALRMGAPFLVERGIDPSEEAVGPALMMRLLLDLPLDSGYFRKLADHPTLAEALWTTIRELRMAGIKAHQISSGSFDSAAKHAEMVALLSAYEGFLEDQRCADMATVYQEALKHPDWSPIKPEDCWTELPDANWNPLQRALLGVMTGERVTPRTLNLPGVSVPRRLLSQGTERLTSDIGANPLAFLMAPPASNSVPGINVFHAGGREAEIEEVFRRILASGVSLDQVEIACASDAHVSLVWEKALRHDWPLTLGPGIPATFTRPGRALLSLCDWIETDFSAIHLRRVLQSGDVSVEETEGFTAGQIARVLAQAEAGWGRATYELAIDRLCRDYEARANIPEATDLDRSYAQNKARQTGQIRDWLIDLVNSVPTPGSDGLVALQAVVTSALEYIDRRAARSNALDHRAAAALREHIGELRALGAFSCALSGALRFVRERVQSLTVASERPRPGHLYVSRLAHAGYSGRSHLFVVGLEEGRVFSTATEDPILLDAERAGISPDLRLSTDRVDEAVYGVLCRLAVCGAEVTFSYSCRDTREFRETYASWLMLQAFRLKQSDATLPYRAMRSALGEPQSTVPLVRESALSSIGWWLRSVVGSGERGATVLSEAFPELGRGRLSDELRGTADFTEFDGWVPDAGADLDPCDPMNAYSVTELEKAAECPFRFFLKRGLGLRSLDERERDKDVWLDPLTRGSELHAIYEALLRRSQDENRRPNEGDRTWLLALARERLDQLQDEAPAPTVEILEHETKNFLSDVELFFDAEVKPRSSTPVGLEVSFGRTLHRDEDPLARSAPVEIPLGDGLRVKIAGRIDRIDKVGKASFEVIDYKTGGYWKDQWTGVFACGTRLQHALYGLAATELLKSRYDKPKVTAGVYYFASHKGRHERVRIPAPPPKAINAVLTDLRAVILAGQFTRTPDQDNCRYCDYAAACGGDVNIQASGKLDDLHFPAFRRLAAHE